ALSKSVIVEQHSGNSKKRPLRLWGYGDGYQIISTEFGANYHLLPRLKVNFLDIFFLLFLYLPCPYPSGHGVVRFKDYIGVQQLISLMFRLSSVILNYNYISGMRRIYSEGQEMQKAKKELDGNMGLLSYLGIQITVTLRLLCSVLYYEYILDFEINALHQISFSNS
ncbi:hypothetical protein Tco_1021874, partial [Tanacetum coccineum]